MQEKINPHRSQQNKKPSIRLRDFPNEFGLFGFEPLEDEMSPTENQRDEINRPNDVFSRQFSSFSNTFIETVEKASKVTEERGPSLYLIGFGSGLIILMMVLKFELFGLKLSTVESSEFITVIVLAGLLMILGSSFVWYRVIRQTQLREELQRLAFRMFETSHATTLKQLEAVQEIAKEKDREERESLMEMVRPILQENIKG